MRRQFAVRLLRCQCTSQTMALRSCLSVCLLCLSLAIVREIDRQQQQQQQQRGTLCSAGLSWLVPNVCCTYCCLPTVSH